MIEKLKCKPRYCIAFSAASVYKAFNGEEYPKNLIACGDPKAENYIGDPVAIYRNGIKEDETPDVLLEHGYYQECFQKSEVLNHNS